MQCDRARDLLGAFIDGELAGAERQAMSEHVRTCARCTTEAQDMRQLSRQVAAIGREAAPTSLVTRIRADLAAAPTTAKPERADALPAGLRMWQRWPVAIAACAAACFVTAFLTWGIVARWNVDDSFGGLRCA